MQLRSRGAAVEADAIREQQLCTMQPLYLDIYNVCNIQFAA